MVKKTVLALVELRWWGHHPSSFAKFIKCCHSHDIEVIPFFPISRLKRQHHECVELDNLNVSIVDIPGIYHYVKAQPGWIKELRIEGLWRWYQLNRILRAYQISTRVNIDHVFVCMLDDFVSGWLPTQILDRIFQFNWSGLYLWPWNGNKLYADHRPPQFSIAANKWNFTHSKKCQNLFSIDEYFVEERTKMDVATFSDKWSHFPEYEENLPVNLHQAIRKKIIATARGRKVIGMIGLIQIRKGIYTLLEVAKQSQDKNWLFVFVGSAVDSSQTEFDDFAKKTEQLKLPNCMFLFEYLPSQTDFISVMSAFDVVFLAYLRFYYPSGNLAYAVMLKKAVIVTEGGIMAKRVAKYELGLAIKENGIKECIDAIDYITSGQLTMNQSKQDDYLKAQSLEALDKAFMKCR